MYLQVPTRLDEMLTSLYPPYGYIEMNRATWQAWYPIQPLLTRSGQNVWSLPNFETILWDGSKLDGVNDFGLPVVQSPKKDNCWPICINETIPNVQATITTWRNEVIRICL
jgi:hypothetical protein